MSSYAKNKQQMCSVTQHQCRLKQAFIVILYARARVGLNIIDTPPGFAVHSGIHSKHASRDVGGAVRQESSLQCYQCTATVEWKIWWLFYFDG